jgi:hypothetical protein
VYHVRFSMYNRPVLALAALALAGCASAGGSAGKAQPSARQQAATGELGPAELQWTGRFRETQQQSGDVAPHARNSVTGSVRLIAETPTSTSATVQLSTPTGGPFASAARLHWSISQGDCRAATIPVLPVNEFPEISVSNGQGSIETSINMALPTSGSYHVNVFWTTGADESDVLACAPLSLGRRR